MEFHPYEPIDNNSAQNKLWDWLKKAFSSDAGEAYYRYPIFSRTGNLMREPDFLILHQPTGLWIIECKGFFIDNIQSIQGHEWTMKNWHSHIETPVSQAEDQMFAIQHKLNVRREARGKLRFHFRVALPNVKQEEWTGRGFDKLPSTEGVVLLYEDLTPKAIGEYFNQIAKDKEQQQPQYEPEEWNQIYGVLGGTLPQKEPRSIPSNTPKESPVFAIHEVESKLKVLDSTQKKIAFEIPEGPQRLRGLAGTGKTVLLAKRLAKMHIAHPDWDIALVFFTRSLYDQMIELADLYHREMHPDEAEIDWTKVKILHAWGGRHREGFYYRLARQCGVVPHDLSSALQAVKALGKSEAVTDVFDFICTELQKKARSIPVLYDCLLIDEGQDLPPSFYQLALQTLSDPQRIYWAYDEAQGIGSLIIPTSEQIFGRDADGKLLVDVSGRYPGGILKTHKMKRCYRTPRQLLMTAHALNMGLFRRGGALQGVTNQKNWQDLGYEVLDGDFSPASAAAGKMVTITRPLKESPHPVDSGSFEKMDSLGSLLSVQTFSDRGSEQEWIARRVKADLDAGLNPWDIVVVALSGDYEKKYLQEMKVALQAAGVDAAIAGVDTHVDYRKAPDIFRKEGCVTVSGIARAKGNEAWKVYACRFEYATEPMAWKKETELHKRNEAFVALTRSRLWCVVTGLDSEIFEELETAIDRYPNFTFPAFNQGTLKRQQGDDE